VRRLRRFAAALVVPALALLTTGGHGGEPGALREPALGLALRRIGVVGTVLYVTAHPDDEHNGVLVMLRQGLGLRTALLTLTRGDGGQNALGPELFEALAVLRGEELASIHGYDGAEQYFTRASDFGYSFSVEETFEKWGREEIVGDIVRVVRVVRPDVLLTLPVEGASGGLHHQAAARLAREAFRAAADPRRHPEQLDEGLRPWQARAIYQGGVGGGSEALAGPSVRVRSGSYDPLLGLSWSELGSLARANHRSQGANRLGIPPGEGNAVYALLDSEPALVPAGDDLLQGVDTSLRGLARFVPAGSTSLDGLAAVEENARAARSAYDARAPEKTLPALRAGLQALRRVMDELRGGDVTEEARGELLLRLSHEERDFQDCLALAHGLALDVVSDDDDVVAGESFGVTTRVWNGGGEAVELRDVALRVPEGWTVARSASAEGRLAPGEARVLRDRVTVSADAPPTRQVWAGKETPFRYAVDRRQRLLAAPPPEIEAELRFVSGEVASTLKRPVVFRQTRSGSESRKLVTVVPALSVSLTPRVSFFPAGTVSRAFQVDVAHHRRAATDASVRLEVPPELDVEPGERRVTLREEGERATLSFRVTARGPIRAPLELRAVATEGGRSFAEERRVVAYDHVQERQLLTPASARVFPARVRVSGAVRIGYVSSRMDEVDDVLRQLGAPVTLLTPEDLARGDLGAYSTIVTGVRAYESRRELRAHHRRLMEFMERGGHLVVQYNRPDFNVANGAAPSGDRPSASPFAPYPALVTGNRLSDEGAAIRFLHPAHPLLTTPNRITAADFEGWIQERGVNFLEARDARYADLLSGSDPWPTNAGEKKGLLVEAKVGRGSWTYVGLGLFRQLDAGVPGAYRILANLVSRPRGRP
jgi:hypothetical protein